MPAHVIALRIENLKMLQRVYEVTVGCRLLRNFFF